MIRENQKEGQDDNVRVNRFRKGDHPASKFLRITVPHKSSMKV